MSDIKVRVGQQNAIKIISSISGSSGGTADYAANVIGGIASVTSLNVSGISTFVGVSTFKNDVYIGGDLYLTDNFYFDSSLQGREFYVSGIATFNNINVLGVSTFVGVSTFKSNAYFGNNAYVSGDLFVQDDLNVDEIDVRYARVSGIATIIGGLYYGPYSSYGLAYFNPSGLLVSTQSPTNSIDYTNEIMTINNSGVPVWSNAIEGGFY